MPYVWRLALQEHRHRSCSDCSHFPRRNEEEVTSHVLVRNIFRPEEHTVFSITSLASLHSAGVGSKAPRPRPLDFSTVIPEAHSPEGALRDNLTRIVFDPPYSSSRISLSFGRTIASSVSLFSYDFPSTLLSYQRYCALLIKIGETWYDGVCSVVRFPRYLEGYLERCTTSWQVNLVWFINFLFRNSTFGARCNWAWFFIRR